MLEASPSEPDETIVPKQEWLLTPGPLTTARTVRESMLKDWGSWDTEFRQLTADIRQQVLDIAVNDHSIREEYDCVPLQGSGTFVVEAMLGTLLPKQSKTLVLINGAYGKRIATTLSYLGRQYVTLDKGDFLPPLPHEVEAMLDADPDITHLVIVHCETSSGIANPLKELAALARKRNLGLLVDSMSAFGAMPADAGELGYDALVSSANKCIEGAPGFGFVIARKKLLEASRGNSHSISLDVFEQWDNMNRTGQWRFTPPTHVVAAFAEGLRLHREEGGAEARLKRYVDNRDTLVDGMRERGFETLLSERWLSPIIVTFFNPAHSNFDFAAFYDGLKSRGFVIYPGKLTEVDSFRVGCIGRIDTQVMQQLLRAVDETLNELSVDDASPGADALSQRNLLDEYLEAS